MMDKRLVAVAPLLAVLPACYQFEVSAQAGYARLAVDGKLGYASGTNSTAVDQDIPSAFGLGDDQGSPYGRVAMDFGVPVLSVSGFLFEESGRGVLAADFGDLSGNLAVQTDFELNNAKLAYAFEIPIGPVSISPGLALDYFDLQILVQDSFGAASEQVDLQGPVPLAFLRGEVDVGIVSAVVEAGYLGLEVDDVDGSLLDIEAQLAVRPIELLELFVGYRYLELGVDGQVDGDTVDTDFTISGLIFGGGLRF